MATISNTPRPGYVWDSTDNVWYPIGVGGHSHSEIASTIADAKGDLIAGTAADTVARLAVGTNNHTLIADSAEATGLKYAAGSKATLTTTGDILYASAANTPARLGIGSASQVLTVASGIPAWASPTSTGVAAQVVRSTTQNISAATATAVSWSSADTNVSAIWSSGTPTRFTIPAGKGGVWLVSSACTLNNVGGQVVNQIYKNGSAVANFKVTTAISSTNITSTNMSAVITLVATDYIEIFLNSLNAAEIIAANSSAFIAYLGA